MSACELARKRARLISTFAARRPRWAELKLRAPESTRRSIPWIITAGLVSAVAATIALLLSVRPPQDPQSFAHVWPILETPIFADDERPPEFSTWTLCQFAFRSNGGAFGSLIFPATPEPSLTLTPERFWSGDLTYIAPTSSNLTIDIP